MGDDVDEVNDPKFKALLESIVGYCGVPENQLDYVKLCLLASEDFQKKEEKLKRKSTGSGEGSEPEAGEATDNAPPAAGTPPAGGPSAG